MITPLYGQRVHGPTLAAGNKTIAGTVVSATTGRPVENADVTLRDSESTKTSMETSTDTEGHFSFAGLPDGQFSIRVSHRGYIASTLDEHEGFSTAVVTGPGLDTTDIRFPLSPQGVIYGVVTDDSGDPVPHGAVNLYRKDNRQGVEKIIRAGGTTTDDLGHYEFPRLTAGDYYIAVIAKPWYATHPNTQLGQNGTETDPPRSPLDVAYPTTYYPDATDADSAASIAVKVGERVPINIALHAVQAVQIKFRVQGSGQRGFDIGQLRQDVFGMDERLPVAPAVITEGSGNSTVMLGGIAPGQYTYGGDMGGRGANQREYTVDATGDTAVLRPLESAAGSVDITGVVAMADGESLPSSLSLSLRAPDSDTQGGSLGVTNVDAKGNFAFRGVASGEYELHPSAAGMAVATTSMTASGASVTGNQLKIGTAPVMLAAMLSASRAAVRGYVKVENKPAPGAMVVLVPVDVSGNARGGQKELFRRDQSNSDGSFLLNQVLPGRYVIVGIEDGWGLEWARPEVIGPYLAKGLKVEMPAKSSDLRLKDPVHLQIRR